MAYAWDEHKRMANIAKHGLDFVDAQFVFAGAHLIAQARNAQGEIRSLAIGLLADVHVTIVFTWRGRTTRIISMRRARRAEKDAYRKSFG